MKISFLKFFAVMLVAVFSANQLTAQSGWELVYTGTSNNTMDISFVPANEWATGWVLTNNGTIYKTTNAGDTWTSYSGTLPTSRNVAICFADESIGFVSTAEGEIYKSTDGGETWFNVYSGSSAWFGEIKFSDTQSGCVVGDIKLYTTDGGDTWETGTGGAEVGHLSYAGNNTYYAAHTLTSKVAKSTNGGSEWSNIYTSEELLQYVSFYDEMNGMIGGSDLSFEMTTDGGENWTKTTLENGVGDMLMADYFDTDTIWVSCTEGIYKSTDGGENWINDTLITGMTHRNMYVTPTNVIYITADPGSGNETIWRKIGPLPAIAGFEANDTLICTGSSVDFTDLSVYDITSWEWIFEGGTPATSTDQNPTVTYDNTGTFDVTLTVTNSDGNSQTLTEADYITVFETPGQANVPSGEAGICTGNIYYYSTNEVLYVQEYEWEVTPEEAGTINGNGNEIAFEADDYWTGEFTIKVRATNICGEGEWSDDLVITMSLTPEIYSLGGGGAYCAGGEGVEITLDGSQAGVDYELYLEGEPTGLIVSGTGDVISFGNQTESGIYEAIGFNDNCETYMSEQVEVVVNPLPTPEITGLDMVCDEDVTDYETTDNSGSIYTWEVTGGTIIDGQGTYMATIEWGIAGDGTVIVTEEDENGCAATTEAFDVFIDDCTDISENGLNEFNVYPNPATSRLNVEFTNGTKEDTRIIIFNHLGQVVLESDMNAKDGKQSVQFDVSGLTNGLYIIKVQSRNKSVITKQIIKN